MQASVGNSIASESREKNLRDMELWQFLFSVIAIWFSACLICLYQPFMVLWMGPDRLLPMVDVVMIGVWFMIGVTQHSYYLYLAGAGLWNEMKWSYIFSTVFNLIMNIILGKTWGITGIICASMMSNIISGTFWQCIILFKNYYQQSAKPFILRQGGYFILGMIVVAVCYFVCHFVTVGGILELLIKAVICVFTPLTMMTLIFFRTSYFKQSLTLAKRILNK